MIVGVSSSNQRVRPWDTRYIIQPGSTATTATLVFTYADQTNVYMRDPNESDIMSSSDVGNAFTDQVTTGLESAGFFKEVNGRWFFRNGTTPNLVTSSTLGGAFTTVSKDVADVVWYPAASLYVLTGNDGSGNTLISTSTNGTTWTDRADAFTGGTGTCLATDGTRLYVVATGSRIAYTTSTSAPFTWTTVSPSPISGDLKWVEYIPEKSIWLCTPDDSDLCAYSTDGTSWSTVDLNLGGNAGQITVMWVPALDRWSAASAGINTTSGRSQSISISDTNSVSGTWTNMVLNSADASLFFPRIHRNVNNFNNRYLIAGGRDAKFFYTRAG